MTGQIELFKFWEYEEDSGTMMAKCPECGKRMPIYRWDYGNFYKFCPYCGTKVETDYEFCNNCGKKLP